MDVKRNTPSDLPRQRQGRMPRVGEEAGDHPASHGQRALWFLHRLDPESGAYNIAVAVRLLGDGDREPLRRAFQALVDRHPALRTALVAPGGEPRQRVHERMDLDWRTEDASGWDTERLDARLSEEAFRPFDLEAGTLLRVRLFAGGVGGDSVLLVLHHAISDLWSITVLVRELGAFYSGTGERLPPPAVRFSDFVRWQEEQLQGPEGERLWAYWRERLAGSLPVLELATDRPRPPVQTWRGLTAPLRLTPDETAALRTHARESGATLFVVLLAAFHTLLHRLTGQEDLLVGAPAAGRRARELVGVVGYFVNPVALRADLSGDPAWSGLMESLAASVPADLAHQGYPFPLLAERLVPERDPSRPPVFQAMLVHERAPARAADIARFALGEDGARLTLGDLSVESIALRERRVLVDVTLAVSEPAEAGDEADGLTVSLQVNSDLYDAATAERMLGQWRTLVTAAIADTEPGRRLSDLPLLSPEERGELLVERNRTERPWREDHLLHEPFEDQAGRNPGAVALIWGEERISYGELNRRANRIAHRLRGLGVGPESRVGVHLRRSPELVAALLGVLKAGGAYVPLDPNYPAERLEHVRRDAGVALVVSEPDPGDGGREDNPGRLAGPRNLAYVLYTSGSTGRPKGCAVEHRSPVAFVSWAREVFAPEDLAGVLAATSIGFDLSVFELFVPLSAGGCVVLAEDVLALPSLPAREEVRLVNTVPSAMAELERVWGLPAGVRTVNLAGEPLRRDLADRLYRRGVERVFNLYGPTEDTTYSTFTLVSRADSRPPAIGRPLANRRVYLLDRRGNPVPDGVPGEVFLGGAGLARGYLGRPDLTAERFVPDAWSGLPGARLYATGDLARWRRDGELEVLGRIDHQVKIRGFRIETGEVEAVLATHPDVLEAAVVVREGPDGDRRLIAYLAARPGASPAPSELQQHLRRRLPDYMVPAAFVELAALPKTASGKVDRRALPSVETETAVRTRVPPRNASEAALAALWSELLGRTEVGVHDSFFDLGGHSLLAARLVARVREEMGFDLPLPAVLASPTVAGLAERLAAAEPSGEPPIRPVPRDEPPPLSYGQRQIWLDDRMRPGTALYNMPVAVELLGALDPAALEAALAGIVRRHEALRAVLEPERQRRQDPSLPLVDLGSLPPAVRTAEAGRLTEEEARRPFDLAGGLFLRALLLRLGEVDHRLVLTLHHVAADGGSFGVLARELAALYAGGELPEPPVQYGDYAAWQHRWLTPERLAPRLAAARERLVDVPALGLGTGERSPRGGLLQAFVPAPDLEAARELARRENATLPMLLLAAFSAVLARTAGAPRFAVGVPLANRGRAGLEGMVGYLVNPVAVRIDVPEGGGFRGLLAAVRSAALAAWSEEELPFELVVRELGAARGAASHPVFQAMHVHQEPTPISSILGLPGLAARRLPLHTGTAKLDLTLATTETGAGLELELEHALDAVPEAEASRLLSELRTLLAEALADPDRPIPGLPVSAAPERRQPVQETEDATPPRTHVEEVLAGIWAGLLGLPRVGVHADLFALGAHSLLATRVVSRLREALGVELPLGQVIERRTVARLAEAVEPARRGAPAVRSEIPLLPRGGDLPLSFGQERLWFLDRLEPGSPAYHMPGALRLRGRLDVAALRSAIAGVVARHEVLRTGFEDRPVARVREGATAAMPVIDLAALPGPLRAAEERRLARAEARAPFRLGAPPLLRARLVRLDRGEHLLLLTLHHIVCDGWSLSVLTREIAALYTGAPLVPLRIQFADWAAWQRSALADGALEGLVAGWREHLAGAPAAIELPADRPRPEEPGALGAVRTFALSADLARRLAALGRERGATPFMVLFAGFQALLQRLSGQDDLVVGTPIAGRTRIETEDLVGLFVNVLPVRARLDPGLPFAAALDGAREALLAAYARQDLPFEKLVEALSPERALGRNPLFQVLFVLQNAPAPPVVLPGLELAPREAERPAAKFDLTLELRPDGDGFSGLAEYDPALRDATTVIRLLEAYERLLAGAAGNPGCPLAGLPLLAEAERHQLRLEWNDARRDWGRDGDLCLHELIEEQAERTPDAVAVEMDGGESWTYAELLRRSGALAGHLRRLGAGPEVVVAISAERSPGLMAGLLAILQSGAAYLPLDPAYPMERLERMVEEAGAPLLLLGEGMPELRTAARTVRLGGGALSREAGEGRGGGVSAQDNLAYVIYTSGSTGRPKGAMNIHRAVVNRLLWAREAHGIGPADRVLQKTPIGFDVSVWELFLPLLAGARLVLARPGGHQDPDYLAGLIARRQVTIAHFVPSLLQAFLESPGAAAPGSLRRVVASGEALPPRLAARFGERLPGVALENLYGPTEAAVDVTAWSWTVQADRPDRPVPIGRPVANVRIHLLDAGMRPAPIGAAGELEIGGAQVGRGYLGRPDLTAERFVPDPFGEPGGRLYRTGDLARYRTDGAIEFLGRLDHQVKIRGVRVELPEIEATLGALPGVAEAAAAVRDGRLVAWVVPSGALPAGSELRDGLARTLPAAMIPAAFVELPALPHLPSGKLDRRALAAIPIPVQDGGEVQEPRTPVEELLVEIWKDVLGAGRIGIEDDFFALGGHSLLAVQVIAAVRSRLGVEVPLRRLFEAPTVAAFARAVAEAEAGCIEAIPRRPSGIAPLSFGQRRLWFLDRWEPGSAAYNLPVALDLEGDLDVPALARSLAEVARRHEVLRARYPADGDDPAQEVDGELPTLRVIDLTQAPAAVDTIVAEEARRPFDLQRGPVLRARLLRLPERRHLLLLTVHHIAADGWSLGVLVREMGALYAVFSAGLPSPLAEPRIQYADHAAWQRDRLQGETLARLLAFWKDQLAGAPPALELPTDRPRPQARRARGGSVPIHLDSETARRLRDGRGATLFMSLLAGFGALLHRYTGDRRIVVGAPVAARSHPDTRDLIGFFVNSLALPLDLAGDPTFAELLARVRETTLSAFAHEELPFERLVEELRPGRDAGRTPVFQAMLALQNAPMPPLALPGLTVTPRAVDSGASKLDLLLSLTEVETGLAGELTYDSDLFDRTTAERLAGHLKRLLAAASAVDGGRLSELPLLGESERHQLTHEWNDTAAEETGATLIELFRRQAERTPDRPAVLHGDESLTYGELDQRSDQLARNLAEQGIGPESRVGLRLGRSVHTAVALLGVWKAGAAWVPLDPAWPEERLRLVATDADLATVLTLEDVAGSDSGGGALSCAAGEGRGGVFRATSADSLAYVLYTSGSTGAPKGALIRHGSVLSFARALAASVYRGLNESMRVSVNAPLTFDASVQQWVQLLFGHTLDIVPEEVRRDGAALLSWIGERRIEVLDGTPAHLRMLLDAGLAGRPDLPLRRMLFGGDAIDPESWRALAGRPDLGGWNVYGPTECTVDATGCALEDARPPRPPRPVIGRPLADVRARVLDERMEPAPIGVPGHLHLGGAGLARGYLGRPDLTADRFVPDPRGEPGERLYRTGDRARLLADGTIELLGRLDRQLKHLGVRIEPGEIEAALATHPAVRAAVVALRGPRLVAWIAGDPVPASELRSFLAERLPAALVPALFVPIQAVPLTAHGKIDLRALPDPEPPADGVSDGPRTPVEEVLAAIWSEVLGTGPVGRHDSFFDLGGHSLLATQAISRIRRSLGVELPLRDLFEAPTVAALALRVLAAKSIPPAPPLRPTHRGTAPLSFAQERLWFLDRLEPGSASYHIPAAVRLAGPLEPARLAAALGVVVARHEALRSRFAEVGGRPVQVIEPARPVPLPLVDLSGLPSPARERETERWISAEARRPFDLGTGPLLRALLLRLGETDHAAALTMHHIASDGWSRTVLLRDLAAGYRHERSERDEPLPALPLQYADFAVWQREWLTGDVREAQLAWWRETLAGLPPSLDLPADRPRPAVGSSRGAILPVKLSGGRSLSELARREGASLFMAVLAAFEALLGRYADRDDVAVGVPLAGRNRAEIEDLIGFFVNPVVMRLDLSGGPTFRGLLARAREATLGASMHQDLPFEQLVEALAPRRELGHTPLFQVALAFQNTPPATFDLSGIALSPLPAATGTSRFDLTLALEEDLSGALEYRTDLYDEPTVQRLLGHLDVLLAAAVADPDRRVDELPLLSAPERAQVLREWNDTAAGLPGEADLYGLFLEQAAATPDAVALVQDGTVWTYAELRGRAEALASHLAGLPPETRVAVLLDRCPLAVASILAVLAAGCAYVPLDPAWPQDRLAFLLADSRSAVVLTEARHLQALPETPAAVLCLESLTASGEPAGERRLGGDALAYVMYTSGSTGVPKGVAVNHRAVVRLVRNTNYAAFGPDEAVYQAAPLAFDASTFEIWGALLNGGRLVLAPPGVPSPDGIAAAVETWGITTLWLTSGLFHVLAEQPAARSAFGRLRQILAGGDVLSPPHAALVLEALRGGSLTNCYGPTEGTTFSSFHPMSFPLPDRPVPIGRPVAGTRMYVLDRRLQPLPAGVPGELYIAGDGVARGYLDRPALTAERFVPDPFAGRPGRRLYRTGDLARLLPDGNVDFLGRTDNQIKIRGFRVEPGEVEAALLRLPEVAAAAVLAMPDASGERSLAAFYTAADPSAPLSARQLRERLQESLPAHLVPTAFFLRSDLPLNANGKVDRAALAREASPAAPESEAAASAPRNPVEELAAGIWAEVLGVGQAGIHDDFFELGGHSLLAARAVSRLRESFGIEVPLRELFEAPTPAGLAVFIERALRGGEGVSAPPITPVRRDAPLVPSFGQERLWFLDRLAPGGDAYNVPWVFCLHGRFDPAHLAAALGVVSARHEALRTVFGEIEGRPVLEIAPPGIALPVIDLSGLPDPGPERRRLAADEARRPFDLARGPLLRATVVRLSEEEHHLLLTLHHAVCDGGSMPILVRETLAVLRAAMEGRPAELPGLPVQYADYAAWQRRWLSGDVLDRELAWWRERLAGAPPVLDLPLDRPRPRVRRPRGALCGIELPADLARGLADLGRRRGATLFMTLLAAFDLLLARHSGQEDLCVGFPVAGRNRTELENLVGLFVNTLVARADLSGDPAFADLLTRVRERVLEAYAHQEVPFERLVEELAPRRDLSLTPLFQVLFVHQTQPGMADLAGPIELPGLTVEATEPVDSLEGGTAKLDLTLAVAPRGPGLAVTLDYDATLFDRATAQRLLGHWQVLLAAIVTTPEASLSELPLLTAAERAQILEEWSGAAVDVESGACLHQLIEAQAARTPDAVALVAGDLKLTYAQLDGAADRLAYTLRRRGAGPDVPIAVCLGRTADLVVALLAVLKSGAAYVPLDPRYPPARLALLLEDSRAALLVTERRWLSVLPDEVPPLCLVEESGDRSAGPSGVEIDPWNLAYIIYTSGSTGRPKGVGIEHRSAAALVAWAREAFPAPALEAVLAVTSVCFDLSVFEIFVPLATGGRVILVDDALAVAPGGPPATLVNTVPSAMAELVRSGAVPSSAGTLNLAGEPLPRPLVDALHGLEPPREVVNLYGPTETTTYSTVARMVRGDHRPPAIGRPVSGDRVYVVDRHLRPVPAGVAGEVLIGGAGLARGYVGRPDWTAQRFVPDPFSRSAMAGARLYRTGDLARWRPDGELELVGRIDGQVKLRGFRIEPGEVEAVLLTHPAVEEAAVVVRDGRLVAYAAAPGAETAELRGFLAERLPAYLLPAYLLPVAALPRTANGKVDRAALPAPEGRQEASPVVPPSGPTEEALARIWSDLLGVEAVGVNESFFDLGGHSLLGAQLLARVRSELRVELPLQTLFEGPTVAALAAEVDRARESSTSPVVEDAIPRVTEDSNAADLLARLDELSDDEVAALLREMSG